jgi:hypothetical protein
MYKTADDPEAEAEAEAVVCPTVISWFAGTVLPLTMKAVPEREIVMGCWASC